MNVRTRVFILFSLYNELFECHSKYFERFFLFTCKRSMDFEFVAYAMAWVAFPLDEHVSLILQIDTYTIFYHNSYRSTKTLLIALISLRLYQKCRKNMEWKYTIIERKHYQFVIIHVFWA